MSNYTCYLEKTIPKAVIFSHFGAAYANTLCKLMCVINYAFFYVLKLPYLGQILVYLGEINCNVFLLSPFIDLC